MAGKPKITLSALKCDAFLNLKRQLASKDKELMKEKVESTRLLNQLAQYISPEAYAKMRDEKDKELARLLKVNSELGSINAQQEKRIKELEATTGCRMYFKNKCNAGEAYGAESKKLKKENAALTAKVKELDGELDKRLDLIERLDDNVKALTKERDIAKDAGYMMAKDCCATVRKALKALEG